MTAPVRRAVRAGPPAVPTPDAAAGASSEEASPDARRPGLSVTVAAVLVAAGVMVVALLWGGGAPEAAPPGLPDAGPGTGWALQAATLLYQLCAVVAVGSLLAGVVLAPSDDGFLQGAGLRALRATTWWAAGWAVLAGCAALLTVSEIVGTPVTRLMGDADVWGQVATLSQPRALLLSAATAAAVAAYAAWVRTTAGGWLLLGAAILGLSPVLFTGHSAEAADHVLATTSLVVHVVAATLWVGGLVAMVLHLRRDPVALSRAVPAFSALALLCFVLVGGSGVVNAWTRLGFSAAAWTSGYGAIVLAKTAAFVLLGALGWAHRQRSMRRLAAGQPGAFLRLAAGETLLMAATVGLAVALARTPTPTPAQAVTSAAVPTHGSGHDTLGFAIEPLTAVRLLTQWQPDAVALAVAALALLMYARGLHAVVRAGGRWPVVRTLSFVAGVAVFVLATCGGLGVYAPALFSVHVARFLTLSLLVPLLVVLGDPADLWQRAWPARPGSFRTVLGQGPVGSALANPVHGFAAYVVVAYGLYATPLLERSLRSVPAHLLATTAAVVVGLVLVSALVSPRSTSSRGRAATVVAALAGYLALFAVILAVRDTLYAPTWFGELDWPWSDPDVDQRRGALVLAFGLQIITPLLLLAIWYRGTTPPPRETDRPTAAKAAPARR